MTDEADKDNSDAIISYNEWLEKLCKGELGQIT